MSQSDLTKRAIAQAFERLVSRMPLDRITVKAVAEECGITRQTFYYHFTDLYQLISWIYSTESDRVLGPERTYDTWQQGLLSLMGWLLGNRDFVVRTIHAVDAGYAQRFLSQQVSDLVGGVVAEESEGHDVSARDQEFIASFYAAGLIMAVMSWIDDGMREEPGQVVDRVDRVVHGDIPAAVARFSVERQSS